VVIVGRQSLKSRLLEVGTATVVANEDSPYQYVSVEGRVRVVEPASKEVDLKHTPIRHLGDKIDLACVPDSTEEEPVRVPILPEHWFNADYIKC
jgi:hypothetical protein